MSASTFVVTFAEILAQQSHSLRPMDYDNDSKRAGLEREVTKLRIRAGLLLARAERLEAEALTLSSNRKAR